MVEFGSKSMFPTDPADVWGNLHRIGNAELAVRLGSINTFDRRGDVIWMDDFESPRLKWLPYGGTVTLNPTYFRNGSQSIKLLTGNVTNNDATIIRYIPIATNGKIGIELSFATEDDTWQLLVTVGMNDAVVDKIAALRWSEASDEIGVTESLGAYTDIMINADLMPSYHMFNTIKLVADFTANKYMRLLWNDIETDIADKNLVLGSVTTWRYLALTIQFITKEADAKTCYIDDVIITQNEP